MSEKLRENEIALIPLVSVTSGNRIKKIVSQGDGFIYAIGSLGVTGSKQVDLPRLESFIKEIRKVSDLPVSLGFGIKNNDNVNTMRKYADGVIVGTSIVDFTFKNDVNYTIQKINELFK
jgi:tryptophan synthase alpha chain